MKGPNPKTSRVSVVLDRSDELRRSGHPELGEPQRRQQSSIDASSPTSAEFSALSTAIRSGDPDRLLEAAERITELGFEYEGLKARLRATEQRGKPERTVTADAADASEPGADRTVCQALAVAEGQSHGLPISNREAEVLECLATGRSNREIADELFISIRTVTTHMTHIMQKLRVKNRTEAAALWLEANR